MTFTEFEAVLELRRYTLHPGRRDELIALFEREFVESQEAAGMHLFGLFREPASPSKFLWLRGFRDMAARRAALQSFYFGPVWAAHREAANALIADSDDVLLLRPAGPGFSAVPAGSRLSVTVCHPAPDFASFFASEVAPAVGAFGCFETEPAENTFPRLPVRDDSVFVWFDRAETLPDLTPHLLKPALRLELTPTTRSTLR